MRFVVQDAVGNVVYQGGSWPMARAALDALVLRDEECPHLAIYME